VNRFKGPVLFLRDKCEGWMDASSVFHTPARITYIKDKVTWELTVFAEIVDDPATCGLCLINLTNYRNS
jgi:hypothetical protein